MTFLVYKVDADALKRTDESFSLSGYNLLHAAWQRRDCPINQGWDVSANELISLHSDGRESYETRRFLIDFDPKSKWRIGVIELLHIYAFTHGENREPNFTPLMLKCRDVFYQDNYGTLTDTQKQQIMRRLRQPKHPQEFVEFLYLSGKCPWNWGRNGRTNAAFLMKEARAYFKQFF